VRGALLACLAVLAAPPCAFAAQLQLAWAGAGTDRNPGVWTIRLTETDAGVRGTYSVDGSAPVEFPPGETKVPVPAALGTHRITATGPLNLTFTDTRTIVDDDPRPPQVTLEYRGRGTRREPGVWLITIFDPESPQATGSYRINDGPPIPLPRGSSVVAVPYFPGRYTITVTATNNDRDSLDDEDVITVTDTDTREVK
jgi:hypothetical protein